MGHIKTIDTLKDLGKIYMDKGEMDKAKDLY